MKKQILKSTVATLMLAIMFSAVSFAQGKGPKQQDGKRPSPTERAEKMTQRMVKQLGLNDYQTDQIRPLNIRLAEQLGEIRDSDMTKEEKKAATKAPKKAYNEEIKGILTEEQYKKFRMARKRHQRKGGKGGGKKGGKGRPAQTPE